MIKPLRFRCGARKQTGTKHLDRSYSFVGVLTLSLASCVATAPQVSSPTSATLTPATPAVITDVVTDRLAGAERVRVQSTGLVQYTAFKLQNPPRLVVDISDASLGKLPQPVPVVGEIVRRIEPLVFPDEHIVRLTLHLQRPASHRIEVGEQYLQILLTEVGAPGPRPRVDTGVSAVPSPAAKSTKAAGTGVMGVTLVSRPTVSVLAVQTTGTLPKVRVKQHQDPLRLTLEIDDAWLPPDQATVETVSDPEGVVLDFQTFQVTTEAGQQVHVVAHLRAPAVFEVRHAAHQIQVVIAKPSAAAEPSVSPTPTPHAAEPSVATTAPRSAPMAPELAPANVSEPPSMAPRPEAGPQLPGVQGMAASPPARVVETAAPESEAGVVLPAAPPVAKPPLASPAATTEAPEAPRYTGERISLDFQEADINDILRLIAEVSGLNVIAGGEVQGTVTMHMMDVPWDQALDMILKTNGLAQEREGNIIRIAPLRQLIAERQQRLQAQESEERAEPVVTQLVSLNYAEATELKTNLERLLSDRGSIDIDERTSTLIITDTRKQLDDIVVLVEKLDRQTPQVLIEARIVEARRTFLRDLGIRFGARYSQGDVTFPSRVRVAGTGVEAGNFLVDLPAAVTTGSGGAIGIALDGVSGLLDLELSAAEASGRSKVISNPKIATLDNTEAMIQSGTRIPFETVSAEGTETEFVDATITLRVTPHVTPDNFISMRIEVAKDEPNTTVTSAAGQPSIDTREATSSVLVRDGDTIVIGGLYRRTVNSNRSGVPWLQNLPVLGWLFHTNFQQDNTDELLIFITPHIIQPPGQPTGARASMGY
ncbi:Type 3 secretion system secretin [Candidatus Entotheonellaceae bacterium PAL068K]